jgi:hypothetical protein
MESGTVLPSRGTDEVRFEISAGAAATIRRRGGNLWIWPSSERSVYATTEPPGDRHEWTAYRQGEVVVRVDAAIRPPERWVVVLPENGGRHLDARWNGLDPGGAFGRLPLLDMPEEVPQPSSLRHESFQLGSKAYAVLAAALWVLGIAGLHRWWFEGAPVVGFGALVLLAFLARLARKSWRGDRRRESGPQAPE